MTYVAAIMLACSRGDSDVAAAVAAEAVAQSVPVELALGIACIESGLRIDRRNTLGVRACYRHDGRLDQQGCIVIGVRSLRHRLDNARTERAALANYNNSAHRHAYAAKVLRIVRFLRRKL